MHDERCGDFVELTIPDVRQEMVLKNATLVTVRDDPTFLQSDPKPEGVGEDVAARRLKARGFSSPSCLLPCLFE